jgi:GntR family transcriptional regulator
MKILLSNTNKIPIYEQLRLQIRDNILKGIVKSEEKLPSIRQFARDLGISVITVKRAYDDLEAEGYVNLIGGKGCFVAGQSIERLREKEMSLLEDELSELIYKAKKLRVSQSSFNETIKLLWEEGI